MSAELFQSLTNSQLVELCRSSNVTGYSFKKKHELINLLVNAGVAPPSGVQPKKAAKTSSKPAQPAQPSQLPQPSQPAPQQPDQQPPSQLHQYIFDTDWSKVFPYLEGQSSALILADPNREAALNWIPEALRILEPTGLIVVHPVPPTQPTLPPTAKYALMNVGDTEVAVIHHISCTNPIPANANQESKTAFYESLITATSASAMVTLPFAGDGSLLQLAKRLGRSYTAMDADPVSVAYLYSLAAM